MQEITSVWLEPTEKVPTHLLGICDDVWKYRIASKFAKNSEK